MPYCGRRYARCGQASIRAFASALHIVRSHACVPFGRVASSTPCLPARVRVQPQRRLVALATRIHEQSGLGPICESARIRRASPRRRGGRRAGSYASTRGPRSAPRVTIAAAQVLGSVRPVRPSSRRGSLVEFEKLARGEHVDRAVPRRGEVAPVARDQRGIGGRGGLEVDLVIGIPQSEHGVGRLDEDGGTLHNSATIRRSPSR